MYKCCVFDLDGTIADTINTIAYYCNRSLEHFGLPSIDTERYKYLVGNGYKVLVHGMLKEVGAPDGLFSKLAPYYHDLYETDSLYLTKPFDGMAELLAALKSHGLKIAVLSNKPHGAVVPVAEKLYGKGTFDLCYGFREGVPLKPDPTMLNNILEDFGAKPSECIYVGDTSTDMKTGKNAGAFTVGVLWGFRDRSELESSGADLIVSKPSEILKLIESV